jgi:hypothetical protein
MVNISSVCSVWGQTTEIKRLRCVTLVIFMNRTLFPERRARVNERHLNENRLSREPPLPRTGTSGAISMVCFYSRVIYGLVNAALASTNCIDGGDSL